MALVGAIICANGFSLTSLIVAICGVAIALGPRISSLPKISSLNNQATPPEPELEIAQPQADPGGFRLYRQEEFNRILAALLAKGSILVVGEEGSGKSVLANAVVNKLLEDGFRLAFIQPASPKQMLLRIVEQLGIDAQSIEGKSLTIDELKAKISVFLQENTAFLIIDDAHLCEAKFRQWLKQLKDQKVPILILATDPVRTDVFQNLPRMMLNPLPEYAIREIMEQGALTRGLKLKNSDLARLQERAGGNPMLAQRTIDEEYLGVEVEAADHSRYVDATPLILFVGIMFMVLRFISRGTNDQTLYLVSGIGGVIFMGFSRLFYNLPQESRRIKG